MEIKLVRNLMLSVLGTLVTGCSIFGIRNVEQPSYEIILKEDKKEIRKYQTHIVAKTTVGGTFEEAQREGFKILAGYIFGKNKAKEKIAMTAPVLQEPESASEKIAMTAPVIISPEAKEQDAQSKLWTMTFSMPSKYSLETLPIPDDSRIQLVKMDVRFVAAHIFSGFWSESKNKSKADELLNWLNKNSKYEVSSKPMFAGYNPPWTIPFFRRNEMLIELKQVQ